MSFSLCVRSIGSTLAQTGKWMTSIPYFWSDAWLLLSVILAGSSGGATLEDIVSVGDGINHAIFTFHEVDGGLSRLLAGGFVTLDGERVFPAAKAVDLYNRVRERDERALSQMRSIGKALGAPEWSPSHDPNRAAPAWSLSRFSADDFENACTRYTRQVAATLSRARKERPIGHGYYVTISAL